MLHEVLDLLRCKAGGTYVDVTLGLGGHARAILEKIGPGGTLIGLDRDKESLEKAHQALDSFSASVRLYHENFKNLPLVLNNLSVPPLDGILADLGVSSYQLLSPERGFSFRGEGPLDMRMDRSQRQTAADLVNELAEEELAGLIHRYGEERFARRIAAAIVRAREKGRITRSSQLGEIVSGAVKTRSHLTMHPATRTFQALRIAVNQELDGLADFITEAFSFLRPGGRIVVISFHSLEDRIVKQTLRKLSGRCICGRPQQLCTCPRRILATTLTSRPIRPGRAELEANPRARSARLRAAERVEDSTGPF
jgi:16S rRNA (cytosine1402-N4)-methyltransferase